MSDLNSVIAKLEERGETELVAVVQEITASKKSVLSQGHQIFIKHGFKFQRFLGRAHDQGGFYHGGNMKALHNDLIKRGYKTKTHPDYTVYKNPNHVIEVRKESKHVFHNMRTPVRKKASTK